MEKLASSQWVNPNQTKCIYKMNYNLACMYSLLSDVNMFRTLLPFQMSQYRVNCAVPVIISFSQSCYACNLSKLLYTLNTFISNFTPTRGIVLNMKW